MKNCKDDNIRKLEEMNQKIIPSQLIYKNREEEESFLREKYNSESEQSFLLRFLFK